MAERPERQFVQIPGCEALEVVQNEAGLWCLGDTAIRNGSRVSHKGLDLLLEFVGGRWRLAEYSIETVLARKPLKHGSASDADLRCPSRLAADRSGILYIAEPERNIVWKLDRHDVIVPFAGTGDHGYGGDGGPANEALLDAPNGLAADAYGNIFIADSLNNRIRRVNRSGRISTIAGNGNAGYGGDGGPATEALLRRPSGVALGAGGDLLVADTGNNRIRRIDSQGTITTLAGSGAMGFSGDGGLATEAALMWPRSVVADAAGNVYVADIRHFRIRKIDSKGIIRTIAGTGEPGYSRDGMPATEARLGWLGGLAVDGDGNIYAVDRSNFCVRMVDAAGIIRTVAGTPEGILRPSNVIVGKAMLCVPEGLAIDLEGNLYVAERSAHKVRRLAPDGSVSTIAGMGAPGYAGDGGPGSEALLRRPCDVAVDLSGNLYIADSRNNRVRRVDPAGQIATVAGSGQWGREGREGVLATDALLDNPERVMAGLNSEIYVACNISAGGTVHSTVYSVGDGQVFTAARSGDARFWTERDRVRDSSLDPERISAELAAGQCCPNRYHALVAQIDVDGLLKTEAIGPRPKHREYDRPSSEPPLAPCDIAIDGVGGVYLADRDNARVVRMDGQGSVTRLAERQRKRGASPVGCDIQIELENLAGITVAPDGNAYFVASGRVWKMHPKGVVEPFAGTGKEAYGGDGKPATSAGLDGPAGLAADSEGNVYVTETGNRRLRRIDRSGIITTVAGTTMSARAREERHNLKPWRHHMAAPAGVAVDKAGNVFVTDDVCDSIWTIDPSGAVTKVPGTGEDPDIDAGEGEPSGIAVDETGNVYVADPAHHRVRKVAPDGSVSTVAGTGDAGYSGDGKLATEAKLDEPRGIAVDEARNLYVADEFSNVIRKVDAEGIIMTFAGTGERGFAGDGGPAIDAKLFGPVGLALDANGSLYVADAGNRRIRVIDRHGIINTVAGTGETSMDASDGPALQARFRYPSTVAVDNKGSVYVTEAMDMWYGYPNWIRKINSNGEITVIAGTLDFDYSGDGGPVADALFNQPSGVAFDAHGNMYIADNGNHRVRMIDRVGTVTTVAGYPVRTGIRGDGQASEAELQCPTDVAVAPNGNVFLADAEDCRVRKIDRAGFITTLVDEGTATVRERTLLSMEEFYDNGNARYLESRPAAVAVDPTHHLPCNRSPIKPSSIAVDADGNVYVADRRNHRVLTIDPGGTVSTLAGNGQPGHSGDGSPAVEARVYAEHVAVDSMGNVFVAGGNRVRRIDLSGTITTIAGTGSDRFSGDRGAAAATGLSVSGIAVGPSGDLWITDRENRRIRALRRCRYGD